MAPGTNTFDRILNTGHAGLVTEQICHTIGRDLNSSVAMEKSPTTRASKIVLSNSRYRTLRNTSLLLSRQTICVGKRPIAGHAVINDRLRLREIAGREHGDQPELLPAATGGVWRKMPSLPTYRLEVATGQGAARNH